MDTTVAIKWFQDQGVEVVTLTANVGQKADMRSIEERAYQAGAVKHYSLDLISEFAERFVAPAIRANALYEGKYPLSSALSRPLIAEKLVEIAHKEGADAVAHGCTSKGNDQVRFDVTVKALDPNLEVIAPTRIWKWTRKEELEYAKLKGLDIPETHSKYSVDQNLWGRSIEGGELEDPWAEPPEEAFEWTVNPEKAPDEPMYLNIWFEKGIPTSLNDRRLDLPELVSELNKMAGEHGVGRVDHMESRVIGFKSREVYEAPAAITLIEAHKDLEKAILSRRELKFKSLADNEWTNLVYEGLWADPLRESLEEFIAKLNHYVTGEVRIKLYKGSVIVVGRSSPYSAYSKEIAGYDEGWYPSDEEARGFIQAWGLHTLTTRAARRDVPKIGIRGTAPVAKGVYFFHEA